MVGTRSRAGLDFSCLTPKSSLHTGLGARARAKPPLGSHAPDFCMPGGALLNGTRTPGSHAACGWPYLQADGVEAQ